MDTSENGLLSLPPPYAWKSRGVREIKMTGNKVSKLDFSDCGRFWPKLESLYLGQNKLKEVVYKFKACMCADGIIFVIDGGFLVKSIQELVSLINYLPESGQAVFHLCILDSTLSKN